MLTRAPYVIYKCDTCDRQTEIQLNGGRPDPLRCNITLRCRGKLFRIGQHDVKQFLFTPTVAGLTDYSPRGTVSQPVSGSTEQPQISLLTTKDGAGMALAVLNRRVVGGNSEYFLTAANGTEFITETLSAAAIEPINTIISLVFYELKPELLQFKKYSYLINSTVQTVRGADDSPEHNGLRFNASNKIRVYVNGIELQSSEFDSSINNQITFTPMLTTISNLIEIVVYNDISATIDESSLIKVPFYPLPPTIQQSLDLRAENCWGDSTSVFINGLNHFVFFASDLSTLSSERSYGLARIEATNSTGFTKTVANTTTYVLLGKDPFSTADKELFAFSKGVDLANDVVFSYGRDPVTGALVLTVPDTEITQLLHPLTPNAGVTLVEVTPTSPAEGTTVLKRRFTLGPT